MISDSHPQMNVNDGARRGLAGGAILAVLLTVLVFLQTLGFDFLNLDDNWYVVLDRNVHRGLSPETIAWAFTTFGNPYYMPLTRLSFLLDTSLYGIEPAGFHLTNLILHAVSVLLVLYLVWLLSGRWIAAVVTALLFAVHPQHIEAFVWVSERKEVLSALFGLLSLACYVKYARADSAAGRPAARLYLAALLLFIFSLLAKPAWITLPGILLLLDWWPLRRYGPGKTGRLLAEKAPFVLVTLLFVAITLYSAASTVDYVSNSAQNLPILQRVLNSGVIYVTYLYYTFVPLDLPVYFPYPREPLPAWEIAGAFALMFLVSLAAWSSRKTSPHWLMGWLWFLGTLFPAVGIVSAGESVFIGNRWTYLPHIGLFAALAIPVAAYRDRRPRFRHYVVATALAVIAALSVSSWRQSWHWQDSESFWRQAIHTVPDNDMAHYMLGTYYLQQGEPRKALVELETAWRLAPDDAFYALMLGNAYAASGDTGKSWEAYRNIVETGPPNIKLLNEMGLLSLHNGRPRLALDFFRAAVASTVMRPHHRLPAYLSPLYAGYAAGVTGAMEDSQAYLLLFLDDDKASRDDSCTVARQELSRITRGAVDPRPMTILNQLCPPAGG